MLVYIKCLIAFVPIADLELSLAHAVHDHVKRDHIFCLSTSNGNAYYLQVIAVHICSFLCVCPCAAYDLIL